MIVPASTPAAPAPVSARGDGKSSPEGKGDGAFGAVFDDVTGARQEDGRAEADAPVWSRTTAGEADRTSPGRTTVTAGAPDSLQAAETEGRARPRRALPEEPDAPRTRAGKRAKLEPATTGNDAAARLAALLAAASKGHKSDTAATDGDVATPRAATVLAPATSEDAGSEASGDAADEALRKPAAIAVETHFAPARPAPTVEPKLTSGTLTEAPAVESSAAFADGAVAAPQDGGGADQRHDRSHHDRGTAARAPEAATRSESATMPASLALATASTNGLPSGELARVAESIARNAPPADSATTLRGPDQPGAAPVRVLTLALSPPEYGALSVRLQMRDGQLSVRLQATTEPAARLLAADRERLTAMLRDAGHEAEVVVASLPTLPSVPATPPTDVARPPTAGAAAFADPQAAPNGNGGTNERAPGRQRPEPHLPPETHHENRSRDRGAGALYV